MEMSSVDQELKIKAVKIGKAAAVFRVIEKEICLKILDSLDKSNGMTPTELQKELGLRYCEISRHLSALYGAGFVCKRAEWRFMYYKQRLFKVYHVNHKRITELNKVTEKFLNMKEAVVIRVRPKVQSNPMKLIGRSRPGLLLAVEKLLL